MFRTTLLASCSLLLAIRAVAAPLPAPDPQPTGPSATDQREAVLQLATHKLADATLADLILRTLSERGVDTGGATIDFGGMSATSGIAADAELSVERLTFQDRTRRFVAVVRATPPGGAPQRLTAMGRLQQDIQVPVPNRPLRAGQVISAADLEWTSAGDRRLPGNTVYDPEDLIGHTSRRGLPRGVPVTLADLKRPAVVTRGSVVTMVLTVGQMRLTARGQALEDGAAGDTIRVMNSRSRTVVSGLVLPDGQVVVDVSGAPESAAPGREATR